MLPCWGFCSHHRMWGVPAAASPPVSDSRVQGLDGSYPGELELATVACALTWSKKGGCSWLTSKGLMRGALSEAAPSWVTGSLPGFPEKLQPSFTMVDGASRPAQRQRVTACRHQGTPGQLASQPDPGWSWLPVPPAEKSLQGTVGLSSPVLSLRAAAVQRGEAHEPAKGNYCTCPSGGSVHGGRGAD